MVDKLQNYYVIVIRSDGGDLNGMKKAIRARFFHCASSERPDFHIHCPTGSSIAGVAFSMNGIPSSMVLDCLMLSLLRSNLFIKDKVRNPFPTNALMEKKTKSE